MDTWKVSSHTAAHRCPQIFSISFLLQICMNYVGHVFRSKNPEFQINPEKSHPFRFIRKFLLKTATSFPGKGIDESGETEQ